MCQVTCDHKGGIATKLPGHLWVWYDFLLYIQWVGWTSSRLNNVLWCSHDLHIPGDKYYLADAGIQYHLSEWGRAQQRWWFFYSISGCRCHQHLMSLLNYGQKHLCILGVIRKVGRVYQNLLRHLRCPAWLSGAIARDGKHSVLQIICTVSQDFSAF